MKKIYLLKFVILRKSVYTDAALNLRKSFDKSHLTNATETSSSSKDDDKPIFGNIFLAILMLFEQFGPLLCFRNTSYNAALKFKFELNFAKFG